MRIEIQARNFTMPTGEGYPVIRLSLVAKPDSSWGALRRVWFLHPWNNQPDACLMSAEDYPADQMNSVVEQLADFGVSDARRVEFSDPFPF